MANAGGIWGAWATTWATGVAVAETMAASAQVIAARTALIQAALADPAKGDWAEIGRMVPEKVAAFGEAGQAAALDLAKLHAEGLRTWTSLMTMAAEGATAGRVPSIAQAGALFARVAAGHGAAMGASGRALAPVRRRAMGNARRLGG